MKVALHVQQLMRLAPISETKDLRASSNEAKAIDIVAKKRLALDWSAIKCSLVRFRLVESSQA